MNSTTCFMKGSVKLKTDPQFNGNKNQKNYRSLPNISPIKYHVMKIEYESNTYMVS